ncbi:MAG: hypothetical protein ACRD0U_17100, partial [Acidimicrobiales bacterium]
VIHRRFYDSAVTRDMLSDCSQGSGAAIVVQFGGTGLRRDLDDFARGLLASGRSVETANVDVAESWWFRSGPRISRHPELDERVGRWVLTQLQPAMEPA